MAKFCSNCGTPYEEGTAFCSNCGTSLAAPAAPKAPKSAITVAGLRDIAAKRAKAMMIIVLVVSLLIGLATVTGSIDLIAKNRYEGKVVGIDELPAKEIYVETGSDKVDGITAGAKALNIIYGIALLGVAALTILAMLENACGGCGKKIFKLAIAVAAGATFLYALLFVFLCRVKIEGYTYVICTPVSAWVNMVLFSGIAALNFLPEKKEA
jgi:hypothetical protein